MDCPKCHCPTQPINRQQLVEHHCKRCEGSWVLYSELIRKDGESELRFDVDRLAELQARRTSYQCSTCGVNLQQVDLAGTPVELCPECLAIFCDRDEVRRLIRSSTVDIPADELGRRSDRRLRGSEIVSSILALFGREKKL